MSIKSALRNALLSALPLALRAAPPVIISRPGPEFQDERHPGEESLARASNKNVRLRFTLTRGSLYAFWVTSDPNGASRGYVAAGGPGFAGLTDEPRK